jgi:predicted nucleic acid-binding protein
VRVYYLDASAWVKRHAIEAGSIWIIELFDQQPPFASASLGYIEVFATLVRKQRRAGELQGARLLSALRDAENEWQTFTEVSLDTEVQLVALDNARRHATRGADTIHLASDVVLRSRLLGDELMFVSADGDL